MLPNYLPKSNLHPEKRTPPGKSVCMSFCLKGVLISQVSVYTSVVAMDAEQWLKCDLLALIHDAFTFPHTPCCVGLQVFGTVEPPQAKH
jgi:hypothetical protein